MFKDVFGHRRTRDHGVMASAIGTALEIAPPLIASESDLHHGINGVNVCARAVTDVTRERQGRALTRSGPGGWHAAHS